MRNFREVKLNGGLFSHLNLAETLSDGLFVQDKWAFILQVGVQ